MPQQVLPDKLPFVQRRVPLKPLFAMLSLAVALIIWFPGIDAIIHWRPERPAQFAGHRIPVPFLWHQDNPLLTLRRPGLSIFSLGASISVTRLTTSSSNRVGKWWLYVHGLDKKPGQMGSEPQMPATDALTRLYENAIAYNLTPHWRCTESLIAGTPQIECISEDFSYTLTYFGSPSHIGEARRVADKLEEIPGH